MLALAVAEFLSYGVVVQRRLRDQERVGGGRPVADGGEGGDEDDACAVGAREGEVDHVAHAGEVRVFEGGGRVVEVDGPGVVDYGGDGGEEGGVVCRGEVEAGEAEGGGEEGGFLVEGRLWVERRAVKEARGWGSGSGSRCVRRRGRGGGLAGCSGPGCRLSL